MTGDVLEAALRVYQGRALYEARCRRSGWKRCEKKYGVIY